MGKQIDTSKPLFLVLSGPSTENLKDNISYLKDKDVVWASINKFHIVQKEIFDSVGLEFDIVYCTSGISLPMMADRLKKFNGLLITSQEAIDRYKFNNNVHVIKRHRFGHGSMVPCVIELAKIGFKKIYLFGADGGYVNDKIYCYENDHNYFSIDYSRRQMNKDGELASSLFWDIAFGEDIPPISIYNVSPKSNLKCFQKISYKDLINEF